MTNGHKTTVKTPFQDRPIGCGGIHWYTPLGYTITGSVVIAEIGANFRVFQPNDKCPQKLQLERHSGSQIHLLDALNPPVNSDWLYRH
jgi:hypothetical protein